ILAPVVGISGGGIIGSVPSGEETSSTIGVIAVESAKAMCFSSSSSSSSSSSFSLSSSSSSASSPDESPSSPDESPSSSHPSSPLPMG
ncbi:hypothetical protein Tco_0577071, partial [Tanacetum coccineum]